MVHVQAIVNKVACHVIVSGENMNNFWGPMDDEEPLPAWMDPKTYRDGNNVKARPVKSLAEAAEEALKRPPLQQVADREPNV